MPTPFMYPGAFCMYPTCILSRGWNTSEYTQNTLRYTYPPPHTWPDPCASGMQCPWKRRMTKDGAHFARIIHTKKGFVIQQGVVALSHEDGEELEDRSAIGVDDVVTNDGAGTSVDDAKNSSKKRAKDKVEVVKKEKNDKDQPPTKRKRTPARR